VIHAEDSRPGFCSSAPAGRRQETGELTEVRGHAREDLIASIRALNLDVQMPNAAQAREYYGRAVGTYQAATSILRVRAGRRTWNE
jgi:hypothetical protein